MLHDYCAVAVQWRNGEFSILGKLDRINDMVDIASLEAAYPFNQVSCRGAGYLDRAAVMPVDRFRKFAIASEIGTWLDAFDPDCTFILVHESEWETGLGD